MFQGKTVAVTGASSGLGRELSVRLGELGAKLVLFSRSEEKLRETSRLCVEAGSDEPLVVAGDVREPDDCRRMVDQAISRFGGLDHLVANAGISMWSSFAELEDVTVFRELIETNYLGVVFSVHAALPEIRKRQGSITVVSSIQAKMGVPFHSAYSASKHAVDGFCDALRSELEGSGVDLLVAYPHWMSGTNLRANALDKTGSKLGQQRRGHSKDAVPVDECARLIIRAMQKRRKAVYIPGKFRWIPWLKLVAPGYLRSLVKKRVDRQTE